MASDDDDDIPSLSAETFAALQDFYIDKEKRQAILDNLEQDNKLKENIVFEEDWQLSQFWYNQETINTLTKVVKKILPPNGSVCLISCPTLYSSIKRAVDIENSVLLLEFDQRFAVHGTDFVHYDFNFPNKIPKEMHGMFDFVIADPPFLSEECLTKTSETIKLLAKDKIILCTGAIMGELAEKVLNVKCCKFKPEHENNLANEFCCFANFDLDDALR